MFLSAETSGNVRKTLKFFKKLKTNERKLKKRWSSESLTHSRNQRRSDISNTTPYLWRAELVANTCAFWTRGRHYLVCVWSSGKKQLNSVWTKTVAEEDRKSFTPPRVVGEPASTFPRHSNDLDHYFSHFLPVSLLVHALTHTLTHTHVHVVSAIRHSCNKTYGRTRRLLSLARGERVG